MINIELKVSVKDFKETIRNLKKIGANFRNTFSQVDTYYKCKGKRLKIREIDHETYQLINYLRRDQAESKISDYTIKTLDEKELKQYKQLLKNTHGESVRVHKKRELWIYKNTRIHLDKVQGLGEFIELETVVKNPQDFMRLEGEHKQVISLLKLSCFTKISRSYSDLLLEKKNQRKILTTHLIKHPNLFPA